MTAPMSLFASCAPGIEPMLSAEVGRLGGVSPEVEPGGVAFRGHRAVLHRVNLFSGLATHVLVRVGSFTATRFDHLEREIGRLPWETYLAPGTDRLFRVRAKRSRLHHKGAIAERAARMIARRLGDSHSEPGSSGVPVLIRVVSDRFECSVDTSGEALHRRGYRLDPGPAPLREDLARALIVASGWDAKSPLVDPFTGSGTLAIEAALLARGWAPGRGRSFALEQTPLFHPETWEAVRGEEQDREAPPILASDRDPGSLPRALENATRAGVEEVLRFETASISEVDLSSLDEGGALVANPPYGARLGKNADLSPLYRALGTRVSALPEQVRVALYCTDRKLGHRVSPNLSTAFVTDAGGLKVRALVRGPAL